MTLYFHRLLGAAVLDRATYEDIEHDETSGTQALVTVLLSAAAAGVGASRRFDDVLLAAPMIATVALISWIAWALLAYQIGAKLLPERGTRGDVGELIRTLGFASTPGILRCFGVIPEFDGPLFVFTALWMLAAMVVAIRQALDYTSTWRAVVVSLLGAAVTLAFVAGFGLYLAPALQ